MTRVLPWLKKPEKTPTAHIDNKGIKAEDGSVAIYEVVGRRLFPRIARTAHMG